MKDIVRSVNRIAASLPESLLGDWAIIFHDTETYKNLTPEEVAEAEEHLKDLVAARDSSASGS